MIVNREEEFSRLVAAHGTQRGLIMYDADQQRRVGVIFDHPGSSPSLDIVRDNFTKAFMKAETAPSDGVWDAADFPLVQFIGYYTITIVSKLKGGIVTVEEYRTPSVESHMGLETH